jgi:type IV pilus assembly protein PilX
MSTPCTKPVRLPPVHQRGTILVTSMLLLLVLTIIGVTAMQMSRMQERMAGNTRDLNLAFQGAEAGLRNGEALIQFQSVRPDTSSTAGSQFYTQGSSTIANPETRNVSWWGTRGLEYEADNDRSSTTAEVSDLARDPRFIIESIGFVSDSLTVGHGPPQGRDFYQVTGRSTGGSDQANTTLRSTYARRF